MEPYAPYPLNLVRDWFHRRRWWVRLALAAVLVPWFGYFAYTRMTTRPAKPFSNWSLGPGLAVPDPAVDRTRDLVAAINLISPLPTFPGPTSAPAGMGWIDTDTVKNGRKAAKQPPVTAAATTPVNLNPRIGLEGRWTPGTRYHLGQLVGYLETKATQQALDEIVSVADKPFCLSQSNVLAGGGLSAVRWMARLLASRARWHMAKKHDFDKAVRDLEAVFNLAAGMEDDRLLISLLVGLSCRSLAVSEVTYWIDEFPLTDPQTKSLQGLLAHHRPDTRRQMELAIHGERASTRNMIDQMYTCDDQDNGWYVPTFGDPSFYRDEPPLVLNLLSPLFEDRRTAQARADRFWAIMAARVGDPPRFEARSPNEVFYSPRITKPMSPSSFSDQAGYNGRWRALPFRAVATIDGASAALALAAYRNRHGQYPANLALLVPDYLPAVPQDPFSSEPLRYRLTDDAYLLYSIDANRKDDQGVKKSNQEDLDWPVAPLKRTEPEYEEWFLVPTGSSQPAE